MSGKAKGATDQAVGSASGAANEAQGSASGAANKVCDLLTPLSGLQCGGAVSHVEARRICPAAACMLELQCLLH